MPNDHFSPSTRISQSVNGNVHVCGASLTNSHEAPAVSTPDNVVTPIRANKAPTHRRNFKGLLKTTPKRLSEVHVSTAFSFSLYILNQVIKILK